MNIRHAVIPAAGNGTRMYPATRVIPKPLITVVDRPLIQYVVEEAVLAGATDIVLVVDDRPGDPVLTHFTSDPPLPGLENVNFTSVVQPEPHGLGDSVLRAEEAIGGEPFFCLLSDMFPRPGRSLLPRIAAAFDGTTTVALRPVPRDYFFRYGIIAPGQITGDIVDLVAAHEKPGSAARSNLGLVGRYAFAPSIFEDLAAIQPGHGGELQLTDALDRHAQRIGARGVVMGDDLFDVGHPSGLVEATAAMATSRAEEDEQLVQELTG